MPPSVVSSMIENITNQIVRKTTIIDSFNYILLAPENIRFHRIPLNKLPSFVENQINKGFPTT